MNAGVKVEAEEVDVEVKEEGVGCAIGGVGEDGGGGSRESWR